MAKSRSSTSRKPPKPKPQPPSPGPKLPPPTKKPELTVDAIARRSGIAKSKVEKVFVSLADLIIESKRTRRTTARIPGVGKLKIGDLSEAGDTVELQLVRELTERLSARGGPNRNTAKQSKKNNTRKTMPKKKKKKSVHSKRKTAKKIKRATRG